MKRTLAAASGIAALVLMLLPSAAVAQQPQSGARIPQLRFNPGMTVKPGQTRNAAYTLGRLQHFQMGLNNVRVIDRTQIVTPPAPLPSRLPQ